jgi:hypothetical protein
MTEHAAARAWRERLARDICFAGFGNTKTARKRYGSPKAYWEGVSPDAKKEYRQSAAQFVLYARYLGIKRIEKEINRERA